MQIITARYRENGEQVFCFELSSVTVTCKAWASQSVLFFYSLLIIGNRSDYYSLVFYSVLWCNNKPIFLAFHDAKIQVVNNEWGTTIMEQENQGLYPLTYSPIPKGIIKEELEEPNVPDEEEPDEHWEQLNAYPPLQHGVFKEESQSGDGLEEFNSGMQVYNTIIDDLSVML